VPLRDLQPGKSQRIVSLGEGGLEYPAKKKWGTNHLSFPFFYIFTTPVEKLWEKLGIRAAIKEN
jgi:hypothetical protein